jgi:hypothetical protein
VVERRSRRFPLLHDRAPISRSFALLRETDVGEVRAVMARSRHDSV